MCDTVRSKKGEAVKDCGTLDHETEYLQALAIPKTSRSIYPNTAVTLIQQSNFNINVRWLSKSIIGWTKAPILVHEFFMVYLSILEGYPSN